MGGKRTRMRKYVLLLVAGVIGFSLLSCATLPNKEAQDEVQEYLLLGQRLLTQGDFDASLNAFERVLSLSPGKPPEDEALLSMGLIYAHFGNAKRDYRRSLDFFKKLMKDYPKSPLSEQAKIWANVLQENEDLTQTVVKSRQESEGLRQTIERLEKTKQQAEIKEVKTEEPRGVGDHFLRSQKLLAQGDFEGALNENQKVLSLSSRRSPEDEALFNLGLIYVLPGNPKKDIEKSLDFFRRLIKDHPKSPFTEQAKAWVEMIQENQKLNQVIEKSKQVDLEIEEKKRATSN